jgi:hypothetical protein
LHAVVRGVEVELTVLSLLSTHVQVRRRPSHGRPVLALVCLLVLEVKCLVGSGLLTSAYLRLLLMFFIS